MWTIVLTLALVVLAGAVALQAESLDARNPSQDADDSSAHTPAPRPGVPEPGVDYADAVARATSLRTIDPTEVIPPYRREDFGDAWRDIDGNGCRQRDDVLARDLSAVVTDETGCTVLYGTLNDPYTGTTVAFQHDRVAVDGNPGSQGVQIDHIVSLAAAHRGGAWAWTPGQREWFANDLDGLAAVEGRANQSKQDKGPAGWLPAPEHVCTYALEYTTILSEWELGVAEDDQEALIRTLQDCDAGA